MIGWALKRIMECSFEGWHATGKRLVDMDAKIAPSYMQTSATPTRSARRNMGANDIIVGNTNKLKRKTTARLVRKWDFWLHRSLRRVSSQEDSPQFRNGSAF
jgi:hypothetical protein